MKRYVLFGLGGALAYAAYRAWIIWPNYAANNTADNPHGQVTAVAGTAIDPLNPFLWVSAAAGLVVAYVKG